MINPPVPPKPSFNLPSQPLNVPSGWRIASVNIEPIPESYSVIKASPIPTHAHAPQFAMNQRVVWSHHQVRNTARVCGIIWSRQNNVEGYYYLIRLDEHTPAFAMGIRGIWVFEGLLALVPEFDPSDPLAELLWEIQ